MLRQFSLLGMLCIAACAKSPESIAPAYVSPTVYDRLDCDQLGDEMARVQAALSNASQQQRDARTNDTVGVILLGLPVSTLSGGNVAGQVAELKGEQKTLRQVMSSRKCPSLYGVRTQTRTVEPTAEASASSASQQAAPSTPSSFPPIDGPAPVEGTRFDAFSGEQIAAYCKQDWETRIGLNGRTEYNPCYRRAAFD